MIFLLCFFITSHTRLEWVYTLLLPECHGTLAQEIELISENEVAAMGLKAHSHSVRIVALDHLAELVSLVFVYELSACEIKYRFSHLN